MAIGMYSPPVAQAQIAPRNCTAFPTRCVCQGLLRVTGVDVRLLISPIRGNVVGSDDTICSSESALIFPV